MSGIERLQVRPVEADNCGAVLSLRVEKGQEELVESTARCLEEAAELSLWKPVGIYDNQRLVGFAMYGYFPEEDQVWLDRLLIDRSYQGLGYGRAAVRLLVARLAREYGRPEIRLSVYPQNRRAIRIYETCGFHFCGETDQNGEQVMLLRLDSPPV